MYTFLDKQFMITTLKHYIRHFSDAIIKSDIEGLKLIAIEPT